ncbi:MAG: tRNA (adenosine(37)-N6)-threonylcarbamoyltransferase complex ATPase subunit type 1 TsaE [Anaerolineales bacterium]
MPILDDRNFEFFSHSPDQTRRLGIHLGGYLQQGDVICLEGNLGSGKTTLIQGIAQGWGALDQVSSPTYVIVNEYRRSDQQILFHLDAYRLENDFEAEALDLDWMLNQGVIVIEWAERIKRVLPKNYLWIQLTYSSIEHRTMLLTPQGEHYQQMVEGLRFKTYGDY